MAKRKDGEGSVRQLPDGSWECLMQSKYINENGRPKRIKRKAATEQEAIKSCRLALKAWEKEFERGRNTKIDKTRTLGSYMEEYVDKVVKNRGITGSTYKSYIYTLNANFYNYKISKLQLHMLNTVEFELYFDTVTHDKSRKTGLNTHALRHTAITIANTSRNANVVVNALQAGHTAIRTENIYTHSNLKAQEQIETASKSVLNLKPEKALSEPYTKSEDINIDKESESMSEQDKELHEIYLKLKEKFG